MYFRIKNIAQSQNKLASSNGLKDAFCIHYQALCFFADKLINDRPMAEDMVEDVFIKIWEKDPELTSYRNIKAVLYKSVKNACINYLAKSKQALKKQHSFAYLFNGESEDFVLNEITRAEVLREVYSELEKLPPECRKVMQLYFVEGWDYKKIARHLDITVSTARNHRAKGLQILRKKLGMSFFILAIFGDLF